ncbi:MAG TPA: hypothetical protein VD838_22310, partial [Anaeromyxobacteraceae bacterium]|nr:hypothetical protein [Anaeromyxobacteraceae bacterium]
MDAGSTIFGREPIGRFPRPSFAPGDALLDPWTPAELRAFAVAEFGGDDTDACEAFLAFSARMEAALEVAIGDGLAALTVG